MMRQEKGDDPCLNFTDELSLECKKMGTLLKDIDLNEEIEREEATSSLYSPIHIGESDTNNIETECTGDSKRQVPFLEIAQGFRFEKSFSRKNSL